MKPIHLVCIALTFLLFSCEKETLEIQDDVNLTNTTTTNVTRAFVKKLKGKTKFDRKMNETFAMVVVVENDPENEVAAIELSIPSQNGVEVIPSTMTLLPKGTNAKGEMRYVYKRIRVEGEDPIGQSFEINLTYKDSNGEALNEQEPSYVTARDYGELKMNEPFLKLNDDQETFTFRLATIGALAPEVASVNVLLTPEDGGSDADPEEFELELRNETETKRVFKNRNLEFVESSNVVDMLYRAAITLYDTNGEELDYAEFRIVGLEDFTVPTVTVFGTPTLNFITDLQAFGITIPVDGPDNTAVNDVLVTIEPLEEDASPAVDFQVLISEFEETPTGRIFKTLISFEDPEQVIGKQYNIKTEDWECEDSCLETKDSGQFCGVTDHF